VLEVENDPLFGLKLTRTNTENYSKYLLETEEFFRAGYDNSTEGHGRIDRCSSVYIEYQHRS
jgi:hypothetical protein